MALIQVDVIGIEATQACLERPDEVLAAQAFHVRSLANRPEPLGSQHNLIAPVLDRAPYDLFRLTADVDIRRVDEVATGIEECVNDPAALLLVGRRLCGVAEHQGAQAGLGDVQARGAEGRVLHGDSREDGDGRVYSSEHPPFEEPKIP